MRNLIKQAQDRKQIKGREKRIKIARRKDGLIGIRYIAPNNEVFFIDPRDYPFENPEVYSDWPKEINHPTGTDTHYHGNGRICLCTNLRKMELFEILFQIDGWARGLELYQKGYKFPKNPKDTFDKVKWKK